MIEVKRFHAAWCGPCRMLAPIMENVKGKFNEVTFTDVDVDTDYEEAQKYSVRNIPLVVIEKDGQEVQRFAGLQSEMAYVNALNEVNL
jgi:thioredoxin 1